MLVFCFIYNSLLQEFIEQHPNLGSGTRAFQQAIEKTQSNIKWMNSSLAVIEKWLTTTVAPPEVTDVRLPKTLEPVLYTVELKPSMYEGDPSDFNFEGFTNIKILCKNATNKVTVHINKLEITPGTLNFTAEAGSGPNYIRHEFDTVRQFLVVYLDDNMVVGRYYNLEMKFVGPLKDDLHGLYLSQYQRGNQTM